MLIKTKQNIAKNTICIQLNANKMLYVKATSDYVKTANDYNMPFIGIAKSNIVIGEYISCKNIDLVNNTIGNLLLGSDIDNLNIPLTSDELGQGIPLDNIFFKKYYKEWLCGRSIEDLAWVKKIFIIGYPIEYGKKGDIIQVRILMQEWFGSV